VRELVPPVPLELVPFGVKHTLARVGHARLREVAESPDGGLIADYVGPVGDPRALAARLDRMTGVVEHGLFEPELVSMILLAGEDGVQQRAGSKQLS
jgi:ribose 5-phosphate isomerase A